MRKKILFTAGGTGGHIFPALAVAKLCQSDYDVLWIGAKGGIENKIIPQNGINICSINIAGLRKKGVLRLIIMPVLLFRAFIQTIIIILLERPDVIAGFGGYATFPVCFIGAMLRIPVVIHEQNSVAGLTNRVLSFFVNKIIVAFPNVLVGRKTVLLGNPVRSDIAGIAPPGIRYSSRTGGLNIVVLGGSLGAQIFNDILPEVFSIVKAKSPFHIASIIHQIGRGNSEEITKKYAQFGIINVNIQNFIDNMAGIYANCDLLICRSGASTVSEICACGIAAIFVPYPYAVDDHQMYNAQSIVSADAGIMIIQSQLEAASLADTIIALDRSKCEDMATRARDLAIIDSSEKIKQIISSFIA